MKFRLLSTLLQPETGDSSWTNGRINALCFSADNRRLAVATVDRVISLYDENGVKLDKFTTKPNGNGLKDYIIRAIQFNSSTSQPKLAVAQSDNIVFVYKWSSNGYDISMDGSNGVQSGSEDQNDIWSGKKTICNKFPETSPISCLVWPFSRPGELVYGIEDGTVKLGHLRSNASQTLHKSDFSVIALAAKPDGSGIISSHIDGSIYMITFAFGNESFPRVSLLSCHPCPAFAIAWGRSVCAAGNDQAVVFYDVNGKVEQRFDYSVAKEDRPCCKDFSVATSSISGDFMVLGNFDWLGGYFWDKHCCAWKEDAPTVVENMYNVTAISWNADGSQIAIGSSVGLLDLYSSFLYRCTYKDTFEINCISPSYLTILPIDDGAKSSKLTTIRSKHGGDIVKIMFFPDPQKKTDRYVVARTKDTLLVCDTERPEAVSEVEWTGMADKEEFIFSCPNACIISRIGEIFVIEYGSCEILASICTESISEHLISIRIGEYPTRSDDTRPSKKIAYLLDEQTICMKDMTTFVSFTVSHTHKIDFIELNAKGRLLLFRDKRQTLYLVDLERQINSTLHENCSYAQWVPGSDVVVSQCQNTMRVFYNIKAPNEICEIEIQGDLEGVKRHSGTTVVLVNDGTSLRPYPLAEEFIEFGDAIEEKDLITAVQVLEMMESSPHVESMWHQLYDACVEAWELKLAERCAAALGNVSRVRYLHTLDKESNAGNKAGINTQDNWRVKGKMFSLTSQFAKAEEAYLAHGKVEDALNMYENLQMYEEAIELARRMNHADVESKKGQYLKWLLETNQEEIAALHKEAEKDFVGAIKLYLTARIPAKAAAVISKHNVAQPISLLESVALALEEAKMQGRAGDIYERIGSKQKALECYLHHNEYRKAMNLARIYFPNQVVLLEERWADYLVDVNLPEEAIDHYVEAQSIAKAIKVAIDANSWQRAADFLDSVAESEASQFLIQFAKHFADSKNFKQAELYYIRAQRYEDVFLMYLEAGMFDKGHAVAKSYLSRSKLVAMYTKLASIKEQEGKLQDSENMYLAINEPKWAISMHRKHRQFGKMIDLVSKFSPDQLEETYAYVGNQVKNTGDLKEAERLFLLAGDSLQAINMYRERAMFEDALRIGTLHGNDAICKQLAYDYGVHLGMSLQAAQTLQKLNCLDRAIEHSVEVFKFDDALRLAECCLPGKSKELHLQYAMFLEDEERYVEAEEEFLKAQRPVEAVDMYLHLRMWDDAMRIATKHEPRCVQDVHVAQAQVYADSRDFGKAEELFVRAKHPELALQMYRDLNRLQDALRLAGRYLPHMEEELRRASDDALSEVQTSAPNIRHQNENKADAVVAEYVGHAITSSKERELKNTLATLADRGDWQTLWDKVDSGELSEKDAGHFVTSRLGELVSGGLSQVEPAVLAMLKYRGRVKAESLGVYRDAARLILSMNSEEEKKRNYSRLLLDLRTSLFNAVSDLRDLKTASSAILDEFEELLMAVHLACICSICAGKALYEISMKCAITLLRYDSLIPSDKRFYMAGKFCRQMRENSLAFILLNRYIDLVEAMEDGDPAHLGNADFSKATNVPLERSLPTEHYLQNEKEREEVKDWVLSVCMDRSVSKTLPDPMQAVGTVFAGLFRSDHTPTCIVTGYPIGQLTNATKTKSYIADKGCLEAFVAKVGVDPWTWEPV